MKILFLILFTVGALWLVGGWVLMLTAGAIHHEAIPQLPAYGFRQSLFLSLGLTVLGSYFRSYGSKS